MTEQIARTVRLGQKPSGIPDVVKYTGLDGAEFMIPVTFKYRTLTEFGALLDEVFSQTLPPATGADGKLSSKSVQQGQVHVNGQYMHLILLDWGLDVPLTLQACIQLADEDPAAARALMNKYRELITVGPLGKLIAAARAQYRPLPDAKYLRDWGMPAEQFTGAFQAEVWPENWQAWCLFEAVATQWRCGPGGVIGLDYSVLDRELQLRGIPQSDHLQIRHDIRVLEAAALESIYEEA